MPPLLDTTARRRCLVSRAFLGEGEDDLSFSSLAENQFSKSLGKAENIQGTP